MLTEKHVEIASKMYHARSTAIALLGREKFKAKVEAYRPILSEIASKRDCDIIAATLSVIQAMQAKGHGDFPQLLALAACVEILEPTP